MSYRFELETSFCDFICAAMCQRSITITRSFADACVSCEISSREFIERARYYRRRRRRNLRKNVTSRYDKSSTCHAQIQFYEARSRWMEVHRQRRGTPRNTLGLRHDGGWIPPGVQAFGGLARQPWSPLDGGKGMYTGRSREGGARYPLEGEERTLRASDGNETRRIPLERLDHPRTRRTMFETLFDLRASVLWTCKPGNFSTISKITQRILTVREVAQKSLLISSFFLTSRRKFRWLLKSWEMSNVKQDFEDLRSPNFVDIGRIRGSGVRRYWKLCS